MSIKEFHILFISVAVICLAFFSGWAFYNYSRNPAANLLLMGIIALLLVISLCIYEYFFIKKTKNV